MARMVDFRKFSAEEQHSRLQEVASRTNKKLFVSALIQGAILVVVFTILSKLFGEDRGTETTASMISTLLLVYCIAVAAWYTTSLIERAAARRRVKELKK